MLLVAQVVLGDIGSANAGCGLETGRLYARRGVVLNDEAVEINHPNRSVRADIGEDWGHPFVRAREQVEAIKRFVTSSVPLNVHNADKFGCWFGHERFALETRWESIADHEGVARRSGVSAAAGKHID